MPTTLASAPRNAQLICDLLYSALKREEEDIRQIGMSEPRIDHFLCSVAFAPELVIGYLLRKEALRQGVAVECERKFPSGIVDCCFVEDGSYAALCEIKGPWGIWRADRGPLREDLQKLLKFSEPSSARRYNAWVLVAEDESPPDLQRWVEATAAGIAETDEFAASLPIPVNQTAGKFTVWNQKSHRSICVAVFSLRR
jgi:hypothetical protein